MSDWIILAGLGQEYAFPAMGFVRIVSLVVRRLLPLVILISWTAAAQDPYERKKKRKPKKEEPEVTQTLEALPDPPNVLAVETARLNFVVSPLSGKGLLSQQTRDALKAVRAGAHGGTMVRLRAFVAGSGDLRRVPAIVSEEFARSKQPLPVVNVIQVGALPLEGAQVVIEATYLEKRATNPQGIAFLSGQLVRATNEKPRPFAEVASESIANLEKAASAAGVTGEAMLRATCFVSLLDNPAELTQKLAAKWPRAALNVVQLQRITGPSLVECEGVGRLATAPARPVEYLNPEGLTKSPMYTQVVKVNAPQLVFTTTQQSFALDAAGMRLAMDRLKRLLESAKTGYPEVVMAHIYALSNKAAEEFRAIRFDFYDKTKPPGSTLLNFEGLTSNDATLGIDVVAVAR